MSKIELLTVVNRENIKLSDIGKVGLSVAIGTLGTLYIELTSNRRSNRFLVAHPKPPVWSNK